LIAVTLDLEMSRNFPSWDQVHWDYHKGNLDEPTKRYRSRRAGAYERGCRVHLFAVGPGLRAESVACSASWYVTVHPVGNHTYDHRQHPRTQRRGVAVSAFRRWPG